MKWHESSVQTLLSLQLVAPPPWQNPPKQKSFVVQASKSMQAAALFANTQPLAGLHDSSVQGLPSLQVVAPPPWQSPPKHVSFAVQALPSVHMFVLSGVNTHPMTGSHESSVQALPSLQLNAGPLRQDDTSPKYVGPGTPAEHVSFVVQALPSLHGMPVKGM